MNVFATAASLRSGSLNRKLIAAAKAAAETQGAAVDLADFRDFMMPLYDGDLQESDGIPEGALALAKRIDAADAVMIASPEYNYSIPGVLKNAVDWISRMRPNPFSAGKPLMLLSTSPGSVGGIRGLWQIRIPFEGLGAYVHPDMFYVPFGSEALESGTLASEKFEKLEAAIRTFLTAAKALNTRDPSA